MHRRPPAPPPVAVDPAEVTAVRLDSAPLAAGTPAYVAATRLPGLLLRARPLATAAVWSEPHGLDLTLRDGTRIWLQLMPGTPALARASADAAAGADARRVAAFRAMRRRAYAVAPATVREIMGESGPGLDQQAYPQEQSGSPNSAGGSRRTQ